MTIGLAYYNVFCNLNESHSKQLLIKKYKIPPLLPPPPPPTPISTPSHLSSPSSHPTTLPPSPSAAAAQPPYLKRLDEDEDVVDADGEHEERHDLDDDQGRRHAEVAEGAERAQHGDEDDEHARQADQQLRVDLPGGARAASRL